MTVYTLLLKQNFLIDINVEINEDIIFQTSVYDPWKSSLPFQHPLLFQDCEAGEVAPIQYWSRGGSSGRKAEGQEEMVPIVE